MDDRLKALADRGADITIKLRRGNSFVQVRFDKETYKATGATPEKAIDRVLEAVHSGTKNIKAKRREKEALRRNIMDQLEDKEYLDHVEEFGDY